LEKKKGILLEVLDIVYTSIDRYGENLSDKMRKKIDETKYRVLYGRRMQIIEPCFADINYCKKMSRFTLRTKVKVNIQWLLHCIAHNTGKCMPKVAIASGGRGKDEGGLMAAKGRHRVSG
jgi:hypothetical protein